MVFEMPYWKGRLEAAKTQEDFAQLLQDLPDNPTRHIKPRHSEISLRRPATDLSTFDLEQPQR